MTPASVPYLCGGIFFDLLLQARKPRQKARNKLQGGSDGLSDPEVMKAFIYIVTGDEIFSAGDTFGKCTSQYKSCQISNNTYIPFAEPSTVSAFDMAIKSKNSDLLKRMSEFIDTFINLEKAEWLIKALFEVIQKDSGINETDEFAISRFQSVKTCELCDVISVELQPFLLSVLHYIILYRPDNEKGKATFESWFSRTSDRAEWKFINTSIGNSIVQHLNVSYIDFSEKPLTEDNDDTETTESEVYQANSEFADSSTLQIINNPTIVNQYGEKNIHIEHVENLKL